MRRCSRFAKPLNFVLFQCGWFVCVVAAAGDAVWLAALVIALFLAVHFALVTRSWRVDAGIMALAVVLGGTADTIVAATGALEPAAPWPVVPWVEPLWMLLLWANFAVTLNSALDWLQGRPWLAALLGAAGGPMAYAGGSALGAVAFPLGTWPALAGVAVAWAIVLPILTETTRNLDRRWRVAEAVENPGEPASA